MANANLTTLIGASSGSTIKSMNRGSLTMAASTSTTTATITAVDTSKSQLTWLGTSIVHDGSSRRATILELTNSTTVTVTRQDPTSTSVTNWELIEWA